MFGNGGVDTLDYSGYSTDLTVNLRAGGTVGGSDAALDVISAINILNGGADIITGAAVSDILYGGLGNDTFNYDTTSDSSLINAGTRDTIMDFTAGDRVNLIDIDANATNAVGTSDTFVFTAGGGSGGFTAAGQLRFTQVDTNADLIADSTLVQDNIGGANGLGSDFNVLLKNFTGPLAAADVLL